MTDFESGRVSAVGANLNSNGKNNGSRNNKPTTNEINKVVTTPPTPTTSTHLNGNGSGTGSNATRKPTNSLSPTPPPPSLPQNSNSRRPTDQLLPDNVNRKTGQMVLNGILAAFSPSSLLSLLNIQKQTGALHLNNNGTAGYIYVEKGEVWDARLGTVQGAYALFQLFGWKQGQFSFEIAGSAPPKRTIEASLPVLQVRATLWLDNMNKYNQIIPSVLHRIMLANDPSGGVVIEPHQWAILTKIVARPLSIAQIANELDQDLITVTRIAADLVQMGIATIKPPELSEENYNNTNARG